MTFGANSLLLSIDTAFLAKVARQYGLPHISPADIRAALEREGYDVVETYAAVIRETPDSLDEREVGEKHNLFEKRRYALELAGATVIASPSCKMEYGYKQSDDQRLVVKSLSFCLRVRPRFLCLVAGDRDYIPLVEELRAEGIRTILLSYESFRSGDLTRLSWRVREIADFIELPRVRSENAQTRDHDAERLAGSLFPERGE